MDKIDFTKSTLMRDADGNTIPCRFFKRNTWDGNIWFHPLKDGYKEGRVINKAGQELLFRPNGTHRYGRGFVLVPPSNTEEQNIMKKATFTSTDPVRTPTHWRRKGTGSVLWKAAGLWNRIDSAGNCCQQKNISTTPDTDPDQFEPCYGDLVITISADT